MDILIWIAFLVVYSIFQAMSTKKKKQRSQSRLPDEAGQPASRPSTLQEALREIQEALQQAQQPAPSPPPAPEKPSTFARPAPSSREPEFHSMESTIKNRSLEAETKYQSTFSQRVLEQKKTYEDSFPSAKYSDDRFKHAHPDEKRAAAPVTRMKKNERLSALQNSLTHRKSIQEAFVLSEILGKPKSMQ